MIASFLLAGGLWSEVPYAPYQGIEATGWLKNAAAVLVENTNAFQVQKDGNTLLHQHTVWKVFSPAGVRALSELRVFATDGETITSLHAETIDSEGVTAPDREAYKDLTAPVAESAPIYTDIHVHSITMPAVSVGSVLVLDIEARHAPNQMQSQDFLYWQGLIAFEAGDYAMAASAMQYSDQVTKWIDPKADYILALSQEKLGKQDAARASWSRMLEHSRYTVYQDFALAGLRRTGGHATAEQRSTFNTIEGNLTSIDCRQGQPYGVMIANGSVEYPARVTRAVLVSAHLPLTCGPLAKSVWVEGSMRPVAADMPLYAGAATELRAVPNRMMYLSPGKAERRTVVFRKHMTH